MPGQSLTVGLLLLAAVSVSSGANVNLKTSDAANTSSFLGATNWNNGAAPSAGNAYFTGAFTIRTTNTVNSGGTFPFNGASLSIDSGGRLLGKIGNNAAGNSTTGTINGNFILNGGNLDQAGANSDTSVLTVTGSVTVNAASGLGALGGTANGSATFETLNIIAPISGSAALQISGPALNNSQDTGVVAFGGANPYGGTITVSNGANAVIASAVNRVLQLNNLNALSNATLNLVSAVANPVSFNSGANTGPFNVGALAGRANQTLTDSAGSPVTLSMGGNNASTTFSAALTDGGNLVKVGSGTLTLTGTNMYSGTTTVNGGSLQLGNGGVGGSLYGGNSLTVNANLTINRDNAVVQGVDFSGSPITGTGSFTQAGSGTTTLNAANSYSGATTVNAGKLVVSSAQTGTGALTVANGARLVITVSGSSQLQPGTLTLGTSAATTLEFDGLNSTTTAPLSVGTLSLGGQVTVNIGTGTFVAGSSYPLVTWTGSGPADASPFTLGISPGLTATFSVTGSTLYLNVAAVSDIWTGAVNGNWDTSTANWSGNATVFTNGQAVLFDDTAAGPTSLTVTTPLLPAGITVNNNVLTYSIASSGANNIGGSGGLTMQNIGTLSLSGGANTYTGPTVINNGTVSVGTLAMSGQPSDIGAASSASTNLVLNGGTLQYTGDGAGTDHGATLGAGGGIIQVNNGGTVLTNSGVIVGSGSLTANGNGTLSLSGASTFTGGVNLEAGQLNINYGGSSSANSAIGVGTLNISANTIIDNTSGNDVTLLPNNAQIWGAGFTYAGSANNLNLGTGPVSMPATCTVTVNGDTLAVGGAISGAGGLAKAGPGTLVLSSANTFSGGVNLTAGTLAIGSDLALGTGQLNLNGGSIGAAIQSVDGTAHTITNSLNFGGGAGATTIFGGTANLKFTATSIVNGTAKILVVNNPQTEFTGVLGGASARTVGGTGVLILSGANTYSAGTTINPGATLQLGNGGTNGSLSTSGAIDDEGTLIINRSNAVVQGIDFSPEPIAGNGSFVQAGTGTTTLNAANTYAGSTLVKNGELIVTPVLQSGGNVVVADGARFGVSANSVSNSATIGSLTLGVAGATTLDFSYNFAGNPTNAALVAGTVTINGTSAIRIGGSFASGTFPVLKYSSLSGAFSGTVVGPRGVTATLSNDAVNQVIYVTVSSVSTGIVWTGTNGLAPDLWDLNTTTNWLIGGQPTDYIENVPPGDTVSFNDSGSGLVLLSNTVDPASITISNASVNYTFQGTGQINSPGGLNKVGTATVTMNVPGTYGGSTVVSNGTFSLGASQTFANLSGNSSITVSAGAPTLTVNDSLDTAYSGNISGAITFDLTGGGQLAMTGSSSLSGNVFVSSGVLVLDSGFIGLNNYCSVGHAGTDTGTLTLKGTANFTNNNDFNVGDVGASVGTLNIQDTANLTVNSFFVGSANAAGSTASGTVNQTGGTVTELSNANGAFCIGGRTNVISVSGVGVYNLSGGTLTAAAGIRVGSAGLGTFNQSGGTVIANGDVDIARIAGATGTYNLDGGVLQTLGVVSSSAQNSTLNLNGGLLIPIANNSSFVTNVVQINVRNGGAVVDTVNFNVTISQPLQHSFIGGDNAIDGGLTKRGNGTLNLTGLGSSYMGPTTVTAGVLNLSGGSVNNLNNLTLNNAALGLGLNGGSTSFSATGLALEGNSTLDLNYGLISGTPATAINISGSLAASGMTTINLFGYGWTVGQFTLVSYTGTPLANLDNFALGGLPYGVTASLSNNVANKSIDLLVTSVAIPTWIPLVTTDPTGTSSFNSPGMWQDGNPPTPGNGYLTGIYAIRSPADTNAYSFAGTVLSIDTGGRFIMKGTSGQVMTVNNLIMNGGLVDYANSSDSYTETLDGNITLQAGITSYLGALSAGGSETLFVNALVGGSGNLQIGGFNVNNGQDTGAVVLAGTNTYTGTTTVATGTLLVNGVNGSSPITIGTNATLGGTGNIGGAVTVQAGGTLAPGIPAKGALSSTIGTLTAGASASVSGTVVMKINRAAVPASDEFIAPAVTVNPGATLTVMNIGSTNFAAGDTFTLFSAPVIGTFGTITLPALPAPNLYWTNKLAIDGTIAVASGISSVPTNITALISGGNIVLSWPADHTGWMLQVQTNTLSAGLGTNWVNVPNSTTTNSYSVPINTASGSVFYRLNH